MEEGHIKAALITLIRMNIKIMGLGITKARIPNISKMITINTKMIIMMFMRNITQRTTMIHSKSEEGVKSIAKRIHIITAITATVIYYYKARIP